MSKIKYFKKCFENLDNEDYMKYCFFICKEIKVNSHSNLIEGDLKWMYLLYLKIFEFL